MLVAFLLLAPTVIRQSFPTVSSPPPHTPAGCALLHCMALRCDIVAFYRFEKPVFQWQQPPQVVGSPISPQPRRAPPSSSSKVITLSPNAAVHVRGLAGHIAWICCSCRLALTVNSDAAYGRPHQLAGCCICACETYSACRLHNLLSGTCQFRCINCHHCLMYAERFTF